MERRAREDREEARRREVEARRDYEEREEETRRQNEQREYDLRHSALMEMENKYVAQQLAAAEKEKELLVQNEKEKVERLISQKTLELQLATLGNRVSGRPGFEPGDTAEAVSRDQKEAVSQKIIFPANTIEDLHARTKKVT